MRRHHDVFGFEDRVRPFEQADDVGGIDWLALERRTGLECAWKGEARQRFLVRDELGDFVQMGVVSWGNGCAVPTQYGIYSRVGDHTLYDWIQQRI